MRLAARSRSVDIFLIVDDTFIEGALVTLSSTIRNANLEIGTVHVLYHQRLSSISVSNLARVSGLWVNTAVHDCSHLYPWAEQARNRRSLVSLLKFECFRLNQGNPAIYLDTDTVVIAPIRDLIDSLGRSTAKISAVENLSRAREFRHYRFERLPANAGFFALNGIAPSESQAIYSDLESEVRTRVGTLCEDPPMICQPIFNASLARTVGEYLAAPMFYNFRDLELFEAHKLDVRIIHFITRTTSLEKPWSRRSHACNAATLEWERVRRESLPEGL